MLLVFFLLFLLTFVVNKDVHFTKYRLSSARSWMTMDLPLQSAAKKDRPGSVDLNDVYKSSASAEVADRNVTWYVL